MSSVAPPKPPIVLPKEKKTRCKDYKMRENNGRPPCDDVEGCKWGPGKNNGCTDDNDNTKQKHKLTKKCEKDSSGIPYKKGKHPKCEEQEGCKWVKKKDGKPGHCSDI